MEILSTRLEQILSKLLNNENQDNIVIHRSICELHEIKALAEKGFVEIHSKHYNLLPVVVSLTQNAFEYFSDKEKYIKSKELEKHKANVAKITDWVRYSITTLIAIGALIVSIIAIIK